MLERRRVISALEQAREAFVQYGEEQRRQQYMVESWQKLFDGASSAELLAQLGEIPWPGALPTRELDEAGGLCMPFGPTWQNHQEARAWARTILEDHPTIAVDGSQIAPDPIYPIPVGAIQIGWFINHHAGATPYVKDLEFTVLSPEALRGDDNDEESYAVQTVNQQRFVRECVRLAELMTEYAQPRAAAQPTTPYGTPHNMPHSMPPLAFFDGSFIISFAGKIREGRAQPYIQAVRNMLTVSEQLRMPLVGFVDTSNSHDIATMVRTLGQRATDGAASNNPSDATLLRAVLTKWGDRTPFFLCARPDALSRNEPGIFYKEVAFCYIQLNQDRPPARLEMPRWLLASGQAEAIVNLVRAECVIGAGYPYAIETADALAVISHQDRQRFYAIFSQFIAREGLTMQLSKKALSKQSRR